MKTQNYFSLKYLILGKIGADNQGVITGNFGTKKVSIKKFGNVKKKL